MMQPDEGFSFGGCNSSSWTCYFASLTNCTYKDSVAEAEKTPERVTHSGQGFVAPDGYAALLGEPRRWEFLDLDSESAQNDFLAGIYLYLLRLNAPTLNRINLILEEALPFDLDPSATISMPIRASDKCVQDDLHIDGGVPGESDCLPFGVYMEVAELIRQHNPAVNTIILTSEDRRFIEARHNYNNSGWRFITNPVDVMQASGALRGMTRDGSTIDEVFLSFYRYGRGENIALKS
jgi:hypothetical protein